MRCRRAQNSGAEREQHRSDQESGRILGKNGPGTSMGDSGEVGQVRKDMGKY
jgi:hypothetical protein